MKDTDYIKQIAKNDLILRTDGNEIELISRTEAKPTKERKI